MRIISGRHRGLALASLGKGDAGAHLRPTSDRVRESLFNILMSYGQPADALVLDLFAGTGALGLEALSRGAAHVHYVDKGRKALALIRENLAKAGREGDATVLSCDATRLPPATAACDLVFLDPPYDKALGEKALASALAQGWIAEDALIVWEESAAVTPPAGWQITDARGFAGTTISFLQTL
ncbi:16S rRNA (guanine(966)-N(2))-methyltransferase RsmD [Rhodobacteraceae bacterium 63075]|nr:16S rRNA (guanine(966)-N(2))-methyltransferase RsmD [Rhodobacteraceae bacterium 63075]